MPKLVDMCSVQIGASVPHKTDQIRTYQIPSTFKPKWPYFPRFFDVESRDPAGSVGHRSSSCRDEVDEASKATLDEAARGEVVLSKATHDEATCTKICVETGTC